MVAFRRHEAATPRLYRALSLPMPISLGRRSKRTAVYNPKMTEGAEIRRSQPSCAVARTTSDDCSISCQGAKGARAADHVVGRSLVGLCATETFSCHVPPNLLKQFL